MNSEQVKDMYLLYNAVYDEDLREQFDEYNNTIYDEDIVEVATEYFYTYGLNDDGIDILIEKIGLESFVEFVYDLSEDLIVLNEARSAKRRSGGESYADVKAKIDAKEAAKKKAKESAQERSQSEKSEPESRGADTQAKAQQPKKKSFRDNIAGRILKGMERHKAATETAGRLARETGSTLGKIASTVGEAGKRASQHVQKHGLKSLANEEFETWVNDLVEEGYDLSEYTWDDMYEFYAEEVEQLDENDQEVDLFDYILEHLISEGYADTNEEALVIMANMSEEWRDVILDEGFKRMNRAKIEKQAKRLGGDRGDNLRNIAAKMDTEVERKFSTRQSRRNKAGGAGSWYRVTKELQARDDAKADIEKHGFH